MPTPPIMHLIIVGTLIIAILIFFLPKRTFVDQFIQEADALRYAIEDNEIFDREAWEGEIMDLIKTYKGRIEEEFYNKKMDEVYKAFNNRAVKPKTFS